MHERIAGCRICGNSNLVRILDLGQLALSGGFPLPGEPDPMSGPLELWVCAGGKADPCCGLLQLSCDYPPSELYGPGYEFRSALSQTRVRHLSAIAEEGIALAQPRIADAVLDIGCNDGTLLKSFQGLGLDCVGIDPTGARFASRLPADIHLIEDYFSAERVRRDCGNLKFAVITSIDLFSHLPKPMAFMRQVRELLAPQGIWITEQAYALGMIENLAFDTICHEQPCYFNLRQLQWLAHRVGLKLVDVSVNDSGGASFRVALARDDSAYLPRRARIERQLASEAAFWESCALERFARGVENRRAELQHFLAHNRHAGRLTLGCGASTRGNVVLQYCGFGPADLPAIAEKHPGKLGCVTPGSRLPIISEAEARAQDPDCFLVFPWYYREEIVRREARFLDRGGQLVFPLPHLEIVEYDSAPVECEVPLRMIA